MNTVQARFNVTFVGRDAKRGTPYSAPRARRLWLLGLSVRFAFGVRHEITVCLFFAS